MTFPFKILERDKRAVHWLFVSWWNIWWLSYPVKSVGEKKYWFVHAQIAHVCLEILGVPAIQGDENKI